MREAVDSRLAEDGGSRDGRVARARALAGSMRTGLGDLAENHDAFERLVLAGDPVSHNYVVLESAALVRRRGGSDLTRCFMRDLVPLLDLVWVDERLHDRAAREWLAGLTRRSSLVDHGSFEVMRERGIDEASASTRLHARGVHHPALIRHPQRATTFTTPFIPTATWMGQVYEIRPGFVKVKGQALPG